MKRMHAGYTIGQYRIIRLLGVGGMGSVYEAEDTRLGRHVALKTLSGTLLGNQLAVERFRREARAVSALSHPHICTLHDVGEFDGQRFLVLELLKGETLETRLKAGPLAQNAIYKIAMHVADGLAAAHAACIVHRDLKPANIFITSRGDAKVLDFGLAKIIPTAGTDDSTLAVDGPLSTPHSVAGTIAYMSPEQVRGDVLDARTDLFSFGVVLYEMVTSRTPFPGVTMAMVFDAILHQEPDPPRNVNSRVSPELQRIILKALDKDRTRRYQSATDLLTDLQRLERQTEISSTSVAKSVRWGRREVLLAGVIGAVGVGTLAAYRIVRRPDHIDSLAILPWANLSGDPDADYLSDGITESLINDFAQFGALRVAPRSVVFRYKGQNSDPLKIGQELRVRALLTGKLTLRGPSLAIQTELIDVDKQTQIWGKQYNRPFVELIQVEHDISRDIAKQLGLEVGNNEEKILSRQYTQNHEAHALYLRGRYHWNRRTGDDLSKAISSYEAAIEKDPSYALALTGLAECYALLSAYSVLPPSETFPRAKAAATRALQRDDSLPHAHAALAYALVHHEWNWSEAEREYKRALQLPPPSATVHDWYGTSYLVSLRRFDEAETEVRRALEVEPVTLILQTHLGWVLYFARKYDAAKVQLRRTVELDAHFSRTHLRLGETLAELGEYDEAIREVEQAADLAEKSPEILGILGYVYAKAGKRDRAVETSNEMIALSGKRYVSAFSIALPFAGLDDRDRTLEWLERAYQERSQWLVWLNVEPKFDRLRSDARFAELVRRIGFGNRV